MENLSNSWPIIILLSYAARVMFYYLFHSLMLQCKYMQQSTRMYTYILHGKGSKFDRTRAMVHWSFGESIYRGVGAVRATIIDSRVTSGTGRGLRYRDLIRPIKERSQVK